jgi:nucleoside-diphosphate-sugar epimerase
MKDSIADKDFVDSIFNNYQLDIVVNIAVQVGVRYLNTNLNVYIKLNLTEKVTVNKDGREKQDE